MIEFLFLDLDDTILDFHRAERVALSKALGDFGLEPTEEVLNRYHEINIWYWQQLEKGTMTRPQVLTGRFQALFDQLGVAVDAPAITGVYERNLAIGHYFLPGAREAVAALSRKYRLFLASNGTASVQHSRLKSAELYPYFEQVFVSQEVGFDKPSPEFFQACFSRIPGFDVGKAMMVGDSLTSDILGGSRAGMATCWVNPQHKPLGSDLRPDYEIEGIGQLDGLLNTLGTF